MEQGAGPGREESVMKGFRRCLVLLLVLLVCLTACASAEDKNTETPAETEKETGSISAGPEDGVDSVQ